MQAAVNGGVANGGGWSVFTFHQVCSQTYDPSNYSSCIADWGPVEFDTLIALITWLQNARIVRRRFGGRRHKDYDTGHARVLTCLDQEFLSP